MTEAMTSEAPKIELEPQPDGLAIMQSLDRAAQHWRACDRAEPRLADPATLESELVAGGPQRQQRWL